ncbi:MAG: 30S ribosomal protein S27ae [Candidatus Altiarchaeales archaeon]|nr:MAG: 30S ribosomal protein S27ae [Candidatus Altiarchaeales archaeon]
MGKIWERYEISDGKIKRKNKICPKCGDGIFMAHHKDRDTCGKCGYTEFRKS